MIEILESVMLSSVQDLGRIGYRHFGICPSGASNQLALFLTNLLVGNPVNTAVIEATLGRLELMFHKDTIIALGGNGFNATLDGVPLILYWSVPVKARQVLKLFDSINIQAVCCTIAVAGGIAVPKILGSYSSDLKAGFGGFKGRALQRGDILEQNDPSPKAECILRMQQSFAIRLPEWTRLWSYNHIGNRYITLRAIKGSEFDQFNIDSQKMIWQEEWRSSLDSSRIGYRLKGQKLKRNIDESLLSHGVIAGVVQVPPSGLPIVLMRDAQTTGGYPKIIVVIRADMWKLAQLPLNFAVRFIEYNLIDANAAWQTQQTDLANIENNIANIVKYPMQVVW